MQKLEVLIQVVSALFDINPSMSTHMSIPLWKRCAGTLLEVLQTLAENQYIEVDEGFDNPEERTEEPPAGQPVKVGACLHRAQLRAIAPSVLLRLSNLPGIFVLNGAGLCLCCLPRCRTCCCLIKLHGNFEHTRLSQ